MTEQETDPSNAEATNPQQPPVVPTSVAPRAVHGWKRVMYLLLSGLFFALGVLGALLPVLPATPFLLLTSYFLVRTSPRLNEALLNSKLVGPILVDWQIHGGVRKGVKVQAVFLVLVAVAMTIVLTGPSWWPAIIVGSLAAIGIVVIVRLPEADRS